MGNAYSTGPSSIVDHRTVESGTPIAYITSPSGDELQKLIQGYAFRNGNTTRIVSFEKDDSGHWTVVRRARNDDDLVAVLDLPKIDLNFEEALDHFKGPFWRDPRFVTDPRVLTQMGRDLADAREPGSPAPVAEPWSCNIM